MNQTYSFLALGRAVMRCKHPKEGFPHDSCLNEAEKAVDLCEELGLKLQDVFKVYDRLEACTTTSHPMHIARCVVAAQPFGFADGKHEKMLKIAAHLHDTTAEACMQKAMAETAPRPEQAREGA